MIKIRVFMFCVIMTIQICFTQIEFTQSNDIGVLKNNVELKNPWSGGLNFCQFSKIDLRCRRFIYF